MNPTLMQMMARARMVEVAELPRARSSRAWGQAGGALVEVPTGTAMYRPAAPRRTIGLLLVRVGLRLASPRPRIASAR
jgi:hypothetical protein